MNKLAVFAVSMLALFVGFCGWLAHSGSDAGRENALWFRCKTPPPTSPEEQLKQDKAMYDNVIAELNSKPLIIDGKQVVNDPERHDMDHYLYRVERNLQP